MTRKPNIVQELHGQRASSRCHRDDSPCPELSAVVADRKNKERNNSMRRVSLLAYFFVALVCVSPLAVLCQPVSPRPFPPRASMQPRSSLSTSPAPVDPREATITLGNVTNKTIQPLLGVNIGPAPAGRTPPNADLTQAYQSIGVTLVRTHDFPRALDMTIMYPDRKLDPTRSESYDFRASDEKWRAIINGRFEPYFRLGDSWNNSRPPANDLERANWVRAAVEVVRHYRQGQWNGFTTPFRYVEIWNEPDSQQFWPKPHTPHEYYALYAETAKALKSAFPDLQVGGPGITPVGFHTPSGKSWCGNFLLYVKQHNAPLDFFSWHLYSNNPAEYAEATRFYRALLDEHGFRATALHVTEWNTDTRLLQDMSSEALALRTGAKGAAILTAAWIAMQDNGITVAAIYRGPDPDMQMPTFYGIFYADGQPKRSALAFALWSRLAAHPHRVDLSVTPAPTPLWALAGQNDGGEVAILLANPTPIPVHYVVKGLEGRRLMVYDVNKGTDRVRSRNVTGSALDIGGEAVQLIVASQQ